MQGTSELTGGVQPYTQQTSASKWSICSSTPHCWYELGNCDQSPGHFISISDLASNHGRVS